MCETLDSRLGLQLSRHHGCQVGSAACTLVSAFGNDHIEVCVPWGPKGN